MATKPNAKDYALPPSCISADEDAEGGLAKYLEPLCLSLAERVLLYNQEVLFLQGKEILQGLAKLNANGAAAAAVDGGLTPGASSEPAAAGTRRVRPRAEAFASAARSARGPASAFEMEAKAQEDEKAHKKLRDRVKELSMRAAKAVQPNDKDILSDAESSATEGREQVTTKAGERSHATHRLGTIIERHDAVRSRSPEAAVDRTYFEEGQKMRRKIRPLGAVWASAHNDIVPMVRTATVGKTVKKDGTNAIKEGNLNKRVRSPVLTSNSAAAERRASEQTENLHRNKKVKVEVKVKSEPGNGAL